MFLLRSARPSATFVVRQQILVKPQAFAWRAFAEAFKPSPAIVKQLRDQTGSPLKDCLKVLTETNGDIAASKEMLRKRGLADAEKRADRMSTQGLIGI